MGVGIQVIEGNQELTTYITIEAELAHLFLKVSFERKNTAHMRKNSKKGDQEIIARDNVSPKPSYYFLQYELVKKKLTYRKIQIMENI